MHDPEVHMQRPGAHTRRTPFTKLKHRVKPLILMEKMALKNEAI